MEKRTYRYWEKGGEDWDKGYWFEWKKDNNITKTILLQHVQQAMFFDELLQEAGYTMIKGDDNG